MGVRLGQGLEDGQLILVVLGGADAGVVQAEVILQSINEDDDSFLENRRRLVTAPGGTVCTVGQNLSPEKEPAGEDVDGAGVDNAHPD